MQKVFLDSRVLDKSCRDKYFLSEELMMENAAAALEDAVISHIDPGARYIARPCVLILAGKGNNGADGLALSRRLASKRVSVAVCALGECATEIGKVQQKRAGALGVIFVSPYELDDFIEQKSFDLCVVVDCIFGAGFHLPLDKTAEAVILAANKTDAWKIACDVPSGLDSFGRGGTVFCADETVAMGCLKMSFFSDKAKDCCGNIRVANLGVARGNFEGGATADAFVLERGDMKLPLRTERNCHKGSFGHVAVIEGEKRGAALLAADAAFRFGSGRVTLVGRGDLALPHIMASEEVPAVANAVVFGPGFGRSNPRAGEYFALLQDNERLSCVLDADAFYYTDIARLLDARGNLVLTPHPKEAAALFAACGLGELSLDEVVKRRVELAKQFCEKFKRTVLLLKGATVLIAFWDDEEGRVRLLFNPHGTQALAKGGSGDVLAGLIASLLAQGYSPQEAAVSASLAHAFASQQLNCTFALTPQDLIIQVCQLSQEGR